MAHGAAAQTTPATAPPLPTRSVMLTTARLQAVRTFAVPPEVTSASLVPLAARPTRRAVNRYRSLGDNAWLPTEQRASVGVAAVVGAAALLSLASGQQNFAFANRFGQNGPGYGSSGHEAPLPGTAWSRSTYSVLQPLRGGYSVRLPVR